MKVRRAPSSRLQRLPKAVFFDMDDTIFDHSLTCRSALGRLRTSVPALRSRDLDSLWHEHARLLELVHPDVLAGRVTVQQARIQRFLELARFCGAEIDLAQAAALSREYRRNYRRSRRTVPGVRRLLERLRGQTTVGVVTNNEVAEQEEKLDHFRLRPLVDFMVVSAAVGVSKPDPEIFRIALERADARPREVVMVGDSWTSDVVGARSAGIRPIWFNRFHLRRPDPWRVAELDSFRSPSRAEALLAEKTARRGFSR